MSYYNAYSCQNLCGQCGQQVYVQKTKTNNSGLIILAAALLLIPLWGWGRSGFYYY